MNSFSVWIRSVISCLLCETCRHGKRNLWSCVSIGEPDQSSLSQALIFTWKDLAKDRLRRAYLPYFPKGSSLRPWLDRFIKCYSGHRDWPRPATHRQSSACELNWAYSFCSKVKLNLAVLSSNVAFLHSYYVPKPVVQANLMWLGLVPRLTGCWPWVIGCTVCNLSVLRCLCSARPHQCDVCQKKNIRGPAVDLLPQAGVFSLAAMFDFQVKAFPEHLHFPFPLRRAYEGQPINR